MSKSRACPKGQKDACHLWPRNIAETSKQCCAKKKHRSNEELRLSWRERCACTGNSGGLGSLSFRRNFRAPKPSIFWKFFNFSSVLRWVSYKSQSIRLINLFFKPSNARAHQPAQRFGIWCRHPSKVHDELRTHYTLRWHVRNHTLNTAMPLCHGKGWNNDLAFCRAQARGKGSCVKNLRIKECRSLGIKQLIWLS